VLTGGAAKMPGLISFAEDCLQLPVRLGVPERVDGLEQVTTDPIYATGVGLLQYGLKHQHSVLTAPARENKGLMSKVRQWFQGHL